MKRRLLSAFLAVMMVLTMAPVAFAVDTETTTEYVAQVDGNNYATIADAIAAANKANNKTLTLLNDVSQQVVIPNNVEVTLDLNGHTLTNTGTGTGSSKATLSVAGNATVKNGTIIGGSSYYNIKVKTGGSLTLEKVTATAGNTGSSMIDNWGTLTITSGTYTGGLNVLKNEATGTVVISDGTFELSYSSPNGFNGVVFNYGALQITGGTFTQSVKSSKYGYAQVIHTDVDKTATNPDNIMPKTEIEDGTFTNMDTKTTAWTIRATNAATPYTKVEGGNFNKSVFISYLKDGFVCKKNTTTGMYELTTGATGVTLSESEKTIKVGKSFKLEATLTPEDAELKSVKWEENSDEKIATVNKNNGALRLAM